MFSTGGEEGGGWGPPLRTSQTSAGAAQALNFVDCAEPLAEPLLRSFCAQELGAPPQNPQSCANSCAVSLFIQLEFLVCASPRRCRGRAREDFPRMRRGEGAAIAVSAPLRCVPVREDG